MHTCFIVAAVDNHDWQLPGVISMCVPHMHVDHSITLNPFSLTYLQNLLDAYVHGTQGDVIIASHSCKETMIDFVRPKILQENCVEIYLRTTLHGPEY
jgi:hypothetical protein